MTVSCYQVGRGVHRAVRSADLREYCLCTDRRSIVAAQADGEENRIEPLQKRRTCQVRRGMDGNNGKCTLCHGNNRQPASDADRDHRSLCADNFGRTAVPEGKNDGQAVSGPRLGVGRYCAVRCIGDCYGVRRKKQIERGKNDGRQCTIQAF